MDHMAAAAKEFTKMEEKVKSSDEKITSLETELVKLKERLARSEQFGTAACEEVKRLSMCLQKAGQREGDPEVKAQAAMAELEFVREQAKGH